MEIVDTLVIGAGVVGLAVAAKLCKDQPNLLVIDKNTSFGEEISSRNSEVIHAGIYYPENSLKSKLCVKGKTQLYEYCMDRNVPFKRIGKLIVATSNEQEGTLNKIVMRAERNHVHDLRVLNRLQALTLEPYINAKSAVYSPSTGIINSHCYMQSLLYEIESNGGSFVPLTEFLSADVLNDGFIIKVSCQSEVYSFKCRKLVNCTGLHAAMVAKRIDASSESFIPNIELCKGHYFSYSGSSPFSHLVYPVPSKNGLGIHATIDMYGQLKFGPDVEFVSKIDYSVSDSLRNKFEQSIKEYFPLVQSEKLHPSYAGIRPKLKKDAFQDFIIQDEEQHGIQGLINLFGIESPGLTASLAIADLVEYKLKKLG